MVANVSSKTKVIGTTRNPLASCVHGHHNGGSSPALRDQFELLPSLINGPLSIIWLYPADIFTHGQLSGQPYRHLTRTRDMVTLLGNVIE